MLKPARTMPQVFWDWAQWRDRLRKNPKLPMPKSVKSYYLTHNLSQAPPSWRARYAIHKGFRPPPPPVAKPLPQTKDLKHPLTGWFLYPVFCAESPELALGHGIPRHYTFWLSADPEYDKYNTPGTIQQIKAAGHEIGVWGNPSQIPAQRIVEKAKEYATDPRRAMGQFETSAEFDATINGNLFAGVGNLSALAEQQRDLIRNHKFIALVEDYWNVMPWMNLDFMNLPVVCTVKGVYNGKGDSPTYGRYLSPNDYKQAGRWSDGDGIYYGNGPIGAGRPDDLRQL